MEDRRSIYQIEFDNKIEVFVRELIREKLQQLPQDQQAYFNRLYPGGIEQLKLENMQHAYCQCVATIKRNKDKAKKP